jgi:hypothetical protein
LSCGGAQGTDASVLDLRLDDGERLAELLSPGDTTALLVYDPADCLSCGSELARWRRWEAAGRGTIRIVLTREPRESESAQLRLFRVAPAGVLRRRAAAPESPLVYRFHGGSLVDSAAGSPAQQALLARAGF